MKICGHAVGVGVLLGVGVLYCDDVFICVLRIFDSGRNPGEDGEFFSLSSFGRKQWHLRNSRLLLFHLTNSPFFIGGLPTNGEEQLVVSVGCVLKSRYK